jgi:ATPase subunit of ABC transporter with duplicated ATPase domains
LVELQAQVEPSRLADIESRAKAILTGLGFTGATMEKRASSLSGGWKMRTALAAVLLQETDILILDEPTNYLDLFGIMWLQRHLASLQDTSTTDPPTLILVSHDRDFVGLCTDLIILKDKSLTYFHGSLQTWESSQLEQKLHLRKMKAAKDKQKAHIQDSIRQSMAAGRKHDDANKLRQAKSRQKKLDERWGLEVSAKGGRFKLNRDLVGHHFTARAEIEVPPDARAPSFVLPEPTDLRFPGSLISIDAVSFRYPKSKTTPTSRPAIFLNPAAAAAPPRPAQPMTLRDINLTIGMGDRIGILGLNGAGKSTLIKLLVQESKPTSGTVTAHPRLKLGYYSQHAVEELQALGLEVTNLTALALMSREIDGALDEGEIRGMLGALGLPGRTASDVPVRKLSGGQLVRCALARILWKRPHMLVLDEVTTHLDYETVGAVRDALRDWEGAVVLISHDRWAMRGAIEGARDEDEDDDGGGSGDDDGGGSDDGDGSGGLRRRVVYYLQAGKLVPLKNGVQEYEERMDRKLAKLMASS